MDVNKLLQALDDESNDNLFNFTSDKLREMNTQIIGELHLSKKDTAEANNKTSAIVLTTHSMDEAEALSTKMGIMVKGGIFKCFGSA